MILEFYLAASLPLFFLLIFLEGGQRRILAFLIWGLTAAVISYYLSGELAQLFAGSTVLSDVTIAPVVEEFAKALPLFVLLPLFGRRFSKELLVLAMASGFGFAILENYVYVSSFVLGGAGAIAYAVVRGITTSVMHGCMTAIIGYGIFLTYEFERRSLPPILFGLYTVAVTIHALYNLLVGHSDYGRLLAIGLPLLLFVLLLVAYYRDTLFTKAPLPASVMAGEAAPEEGVYGPGMVGQRREVPEEE
ncbi:MAG TPA: PrsW family glutamic-type intramembrane protease [Methanomicrobiales archaeon]|nr:PrsW family glutamic-type intramembrane protease [Methanomicrobiales archaeon]